MGKPRRLATDSAQSIPVIITGRDRAKARKRAKHSLASYTILVDPGGMGSSGDEAFAVSTGGVVFAFKDGSDGVKFGFAPAVPVMSDGAGKLYALDGEGAVDADVLPFEWQKTVRPEDGDRGAPPPPKGMTGLITRGTIHGSAINNVFQPGEWHVTDWFDGSRARNSTIWRDHDGTLPSITRFAGEHTLAVLPFVFSQGAAGLALNLDGGGPRRPESVITPGQPGDPDGRASEIQNAMRGGDGITRPGTYEGNVRKYYEQQRTFAPANSTSPPVGRFGRGLATFHEVTPKGANAVGHIGDVFISDGPDCTRHRIGELNGHTETGGHIRTTTPFKVEGDPVRDGALDFEAALYPRARDQAIPHAVHLRMDSATGLWRWHGTSPFVPVPKKKLTTTVGEPPPEDTELPNMTLWVPKVPQQEQPQFPPGHPFVPPGDDDIRVGEPQPRNRTTTPGPNGEVETPRPPAVTTEEAAPRPPAYQADKDRAKKLAQEAYNAKLLEIQRQVEAGAITEQEALDALARARSEYAAELSEINAGISPRLTAAGKPIDDEDARGVAYSVQETGAPSWHGLPLPVPQLTTGALPPTYDPQQLASDQPGFAAAFDAAPRGMHQQYIAPQTNAGEPIIPAGGYLEDGNPRPAANVIVANLPEDKNAYLPAGVNGNVALSGTSALTPAIWHDKSIVHWFGGYPAQVSGATTMVDGHRLSVTSTQLLLEAFNSSGTEIVKVFDIECGTRLTRSFRLQDTGETISGGVVTVATTNSPGMVITSESGTTDTLDSINSGAVDYVYILRPASGHTITISGAGNIITAAPVVLATNGVMVYNIDGTNWYLLGCCP